MKNIVAITKEEAKKIRIELPGTRLSSPTRHGKIFLEESAAAMDCLRKIRTSRMNCSPVDKVVKID